MVVLNPDRLIETQACFADDGNLVLADSCDQVIITPGSLGTLVDYIQEHITGNAPVKGSMTAEQFLEAGPKVTLREDGVNYSGDTISLDDAGDLEFQLRCLDLNYYIGRSNLPRLYALLEAAKDCGVFKPEPVEIKLNNLVEDDQPCRHCQVMELLQDASQEDLMAVIQDALALVKTA